MKKITAKSAQELTEHYEAINEKATELLSPELTPEQYLKHLVENEYFEDSVMFLAHALPKRESIWWSCVCVRTTTSEKSSADDIAALKMAEKWVYEPDDKTRRLCGRLAEKGEYKSAQSWTAASVFWSGGSITEEGDPAMEPAPYLYAHAVSGSILSAVGMVEPDQITERFQTFLKKGINIAEGGNG